MVQVQFSAIRTKLSGFLQNGTLIFLFNSSLLQTFWAIPLRVDPHLNRRHDWTAGGKRSGEYFAKTHCYWIQGHKSLWSQRFNKYKYDHREGKKNKGWGTAWLMPPKCLQFFHLCWFFLRGENREAVFAAAHRTPGMQASSWVRTRPESWLSLAVCAMKSETEVFFFYPFQNNIENLI